MLGHTRSRELALMATSYPSLRTQLAGLAQCPLCCSCLLLGTLAWGVEAGRGHKHELSLSGPGVGGGVCPGNEDQGEEEEAPGAPSSLLKEQCPLLSAPQRARLPTTPRPRLPALAASSEDHGQVPRALLRRGRGRPRAAGRQKREAFFFSSLRFQRASLPNSSGDMAKTLEKSSADRCLSSRIRSTPGGNLVRPLLVTTSIS